MQTSVSLHSYFQGVNIDYSGSFKWAWNATRTELVPLPPSGMANPQLLDAEGLNHTSIGWYKLSVELEDASDFQTLTFADGSQKTRFVVRLFVRLIAFNRSTNERQILDQWPSGTDSPYEDAGAYV